MRQQGRVTAPSASRDLLPGPLRRENTGFASPRSCACCASANSASPTARRGKSGGGLTRPASRAGAAEPPGRDQPRLHDRALVKGGDYRFWPLERRAVRTDNGRAGK